MGRQVGSQYQRTLKEAGYRVVRRLGPARVVLREVSTVRNIPPKKCELWVITDIFYTGDVIEILGKGYQFSRNIECPEAKRSPKYRVNSRMNIVAKSDMRQTHKKGSRRTARR